QGVTSAWTIARSLERIADHAVTLGEVGPRLADLGADRGLLRELRQFHGQAMAHLTEVLGSPDGSRANDLLDVGEALLAGGRALSERLLPAVGDGSMPPASAAAVARALEAIGRTVAYSQDIAQTFFDRALRSPSLPLPPDAALAVPTLAG
ncbi:MAG TPA: PhoU domain-containing protein, partial [Thermoplasmata archaeon]|nr:PhoU domain-containing protein [Thermoplasmata archaeon]